MILRTENVMDEQNIARFTQLTLNQDFIGLTVFNKNVFSILTNTTILKYHANLSFWKTQNMFDSY